MSQTSSRLGVLAFAYPAVTSFVVLTTANHYVLDVVAGAMLSGVVIVLMTRLLPRRASAG
jgi:membrane-associated phospholipid phosphatase